jgi:predicted TIM-barrel fold metal-dependent hydrolase
MKKIDCHMHVSGGSFRYAGAEARNVVDAADRLGIDQLICSMPVVGGRWAPPEEVRACNDAMLAAMREYPERILGYCFLNPGYTREALEELDRCVVGEGMVGVKLYNQYKIHDPVVFPIIERTIELGVPILVHAGRLVDPADIAQQPNCSHAADFVEVGRRYPEAMIIEAHIAGGGDWEWSLKVLRDAPPSIYIDTSGSVMDAGLIERCVRDFGVERMLFATDLTMEGGVAKILDAELTEEQRERIFWRNIQAVFDRRRV